MSKFLYKLIINVLTFFGVLCLTSIKQVAYATTITVTGSWVVLVLVAAVGVSIVQQLKEREQPPQQL